ncbi:MAG: ABC transporter permease [Planctomycetaceae bacterium]|nr:ABC transporter permease [Planctomycetaceae bacterium]
MRHWLSGLCMLLALSSVARGEINIGDKGGITYSVSSSKTPQVVDDENEIVITADAKRLEIKFKAGRLVYDGKDCGTIKTGDRVAIEPDGKITVNDESRPVTGLVAAWRFFVKHWREFLYGSLAAALALMVLLSLIGKVPVSYNVRNLFVRWKTTVMTALAFTLVVALMTVMMAFVNGMYTLTESSGQLGNVMILSSGSNDEGFSNLAFDDVGNVEKMEGIQPYGNDKRLASKEVFVMGNQTIPVGPGQKPKRRFVQIRGIEDPVVAALVHALSLKPGGQWFSEAGVEEVSGDKASTQNLIQAVIGNGLAAEMGSDRAGGKPLTVGDTFPLADRTWKIAGVLDSSGSTFDSEIWVKRQIAGEQFGKPASYTSIVVRAAGEKEAIKLADKVKASKETALNALTEKQYYSNMAETSKQFLYAIVVVAMVMAAGGVFGVMNTMFAAISQRSKDIGVLRIMGYQRRQILISFLLESLVLALIGGLVGCAAGMLADGWTARSIISGGGGAKFVVLRLVVSKEILAAGLLLSLFMGMLGGFFPAISAMRLRALESLR